MPRKLVRLMKFGNDASDAPLDFGIDNQRGIIGRRFALDQQIGELRAHGNEPKRLLRLLVNQFAYLICKCDMTAARFRCSHLQSHRNKALIIFF
ncbi:hypothetical protein ATO13_23581 [Stappia sp. 22II-S9-Z10]|nr:hypothetical protein ATO13_23581 [Stappia sp. 22II-S9-Z10]